MNEAGLAWLIFVQHLVKFFSFLSRQARIALKVTSTAGQRVKSRRCRTITDGKQRPMTDLMQPICVELETAVPHVCIQST